MLDSSTTSACHLKFLLARVKLAVPFPAAGSLPATAAFRLEARGRGQGQSAQPLEPRRERPPVSRAGANHRRFQQVQEEWSRRPQLLIEQFCPG